MLNWGYAWARFQGDEDSEVAGMVGVAPLPAFEGNESATCVGGWQWAINPYSENKEVAFDVIQVLFFAGVSSAPGPSKRAASRSAPNFFKTPRFWRPTRILKGFTT